MGGKGFHVSDGEGSHSVLQNNCMFSEKKEFVEQGNRMKIYAYFAEVREGFFFFRNQKAEKWGEMSNK